VSGNSRGTRLSDTALESGLSQLRLNLSTSDPTSDPTSLSGFASFASCTTNGEDRPQRGVSPSEHTPERYLELCISVGRRTVLVEVPLAHIQTDGQLFGVVYRRYEEVRGESFWASLLLKPTAVHFVKASFPILKLSWTSLIWSSSISREDARYILMRPKEPIVGHRKTKWTVASGIGLPRKSHLAHFFIV
jgi:hypothetical protein